MLGLETMIRVGKFAEFIRLLLRRKDNLDMLLWKLAKDLLHRGHLIAVSRYEHHLVELIEKGRSKNLNGKLNVRFLLFVGLIFSTAKLTILGHL